MSDLISREDALKHIKAYRDAFKGDFGIDSEDGDDASHHFGYIAGLNRATRLIEGLPSAEPKRGMWVDIVELDSGDYPFKVGVCCSACGFETLSEDNYCPACGTKMEENK